MIITKNPHTWIKVVDEKTGQTLEIMNSESYKHNYTIGFEVNFANSATPQSSTVTFYNLSKEHRDFFKKGQKVYLYFAWGTHKKLLVEGYITKIDSQTSDGVTDTQVITFKEGTDYSNVKARELKVDKKKTYNKYQTVKKRGKGHYHTYYTYKYETTTYKRGPKKGQKRVIRHPQKHREWVKGKLKNHRIKTKATKTVRVNKAFRAGTSYKQVIQGIASTTGIKISKLELAKNPSLKKAYTAKGKPLNLIKQFVKNADSAITYVRGKMEIVDPKSTKRTWYEIDDKDLIQPPSYNESDSDKSSDGTWEINIPLVPDITVNVGIHMKSRYLEGYFYVTAGQHTNDGENPQTQCSIKKI